MCLQRSGHASHRTILRPTFILCALPLHLPQSRYYQLTARQVFMRPAAEFKNFICNTKFSGLGQLSRYSDSLRAGRSGNRSPLGTRFSAPVQTGPGAHPPIHTMDTGSFPGEKRPGRGVHHPPPSSAEVKEKIEVYINSPSRPSWRVLGRTLPLPLKRKFHNNLATYANVGIASWNRPEPPTPQPVTYTPSMTQSP